MKIGLDFDSTITKHPQFFATLTKNPANEYYVVTARPEKDREYVEGYLKNHGISVTRVMMITEDLSRSDDRTYIDTVFREKPYLFKTLKLEVAYDDDLRILNRLKTELPDLICILVL